MPEAALLIDLDAIAANYARLRAEAGGCRVAAVVKADAYGLGAERVAARLWAAGCADFFVARLAEGLALRRHLPKARIVVLEGPVPCEVADFVAAALVPTLNTPGQVELWGDAGRRLERPLPAALHLDTGMCRLGISATEAAGLDADRLRAIDVALVMSHLACAEETANPMNPLQAARFSEMSRRLPAAPRSLANSSGIFLGPAYHFDLLRPGAALYGINPTPGRPNPMQPVVRIRAPVLQVHRLDAPGTVGYGAAHATSSGSRIATVGVGYADGYMRAAGTGGVAVIAGREVPIVGRISMDLMTLDVTALGEHEVETGTPVDLLAGPGGIDRVAEVAGTIGYELLTRLGQRLRRVYLEATGA
jgi:alanine racemase